MNKYFLYCSRYIHFQLYLMAKRGTACRYPALLVTLITRNSYLRYIGGIYTIYYLLNLLTIRRFFSNFF